MSATVALLASAPTLAVATGWATAARRVAALRRRLTTDPLTGLANREALATRLGMARHGAATVGLLLLDLDEFKPVNDRYGHDEGNTVLCHVADQLRVAALPAELAVRLHGDEFALLLGALPAGALGRRTAAHRATVISRAIAQPLVTGRACHWITASVGAAVLPARHATLSALLAAADAAMYRAKRHHHARHATPHAGGVS